MANERMINRASVGIVYVASPGQYAISDAERAHILAEVQEGLSGLAAREPQATLTWAYQTVNVNLPSFTPWEGANWPGLTEPFYRGMDAALWSGMNTKIYFFNGNEYIRVDPNAGWAAEPGYPKPIAGNWPGFPATFATGVDAALWSQTNQRIYFFKGSQYIRVDPNAGWSVESGYPKPIAGNWPGFPTTFANGVNAALWSQTNQKIYFFKDSEYIRVDPNAGWNVEAGYPKPVGLGWDAEDKWRDPALAQLGFPAGDAGITQLNQYFQNAASAQYGFTTFFTKMPTAWFAYQGGLRVVMRQTGTGPFTTWTSIDRIFAHETGHVFGAADEYSASNCTCDGIHGSWFKDVNGNCELCAAAPVDCLMKYNTLTNICTFSRTAFGWAAFLTKVSAGVFVGANSKLYIFDGKYYLRYTGFTLDADYPKLIAGNWPGFPSQFAAGVDAALWSPTNSRVYFFKGNQYVRVDPNAGWNVEPGYPKPIAGNWPGFPPEFTTGVDASLWAPTNSRIYFFKGAQYVRVNPAQSWNVEPGYPKSIAGNWPGVPGNFATGVDTSLWGQNNQRVYFFKGRQYLRLNPSNNWAVEPGYPRDINVNWMPFPTG